MFEFSKTHLPAAASNKLCEARTYTSAPIARSMKPYRKWRHSISGSDSVLFYRKFSIHKINNFSFRFSFDQFITSKLLEIRSCGTKSLTAIEYIQCDDTKFERENTDPVDCAIQLFLFVHAIYVEADTILSQIARRSLNHLIVGFTVLGENILDENYSALIISANLLHLSSDGSLLNISLGTVAGAAGTRPIIVCFDCKCRSTSSAVI